MVEMPEELSFKEKEAAVGKCAYTLLTLFVTAGWLCGMYASGHCNFAQRVVKFEDGVTLDSFCDSLEASDFEIRLCQSVLRDHGVGFYSVSTYIVFLWYGVWCTTDPNNLERERRAAGMIASCEKSGIWYAY